MKKAIKKVIFSLSIMIPLFLLFMLFVSFYLNSRDIKYNENSEYIKEIYIDDPFFEF